MATFVDTSTLLVSVDENGLMKPSEKGGDKLSQMLSLSLSNLKMIRKMEFRWHRLGDQFAKEISSFMKHSHNLTSIDLSDNYITDVGCKDIAIAMGTCTCVQSLNISGNKIGDLGVATLSTVLTSNSTLSELNLSGNNIEKMGMQALGGGLRVNRGLKSICLVENFFGDQGALELGWALSYNSCLTSLTLRSNDIANAGAVVLAAGLAKNHTLRHLNLSDNSVGNRGSTQLSEALFVNTTLEILDLSLNDIESEGKDALLDAIDFSFRCEPISDVNILALAMCTHPRLGADSMLWKLFVPEAHNNFKKVLVSGKKMSAHDKSTLVRFERDAGDKERCDFSAYQDQCLQQDSPIRKVLLHTILQKPREILFDGYQVNPETSASSNSKGRVGRSGDSSTANSLAARSPPTQRGASLGMAQLSKAVVQIHTKAHTPTSPNVRRMPRPQDQGTPAPE